LFLEIQKAWDARDRARLAELVGPDLLQEWSRRLDDFDKKRWHNRVEVLEGPKVDYLGLVNRADDRDDRVVVHVEARLRDYVVDAAGATITHTGTSSQFNDLREWWTLRKKGDTDRWRLLSIEQDAEGAPLAAVASPAAVDQLLYPGDPSKKTRMVVRGLKLEGVRITGLDASAEPPTMTVEVRVRGRRYVENRDTATIVSGSQSGDV